MIDPSPPADLSEHASRAAAGRQIPTATATAQEASGSRTLQPTYDPVLHGGYVSRLIGGISSNPRCRNIALAGTYGSGKSSILQGFQLELNKSDIRAIQVSLTAVGASREELLKATGEETLTAALEKDVVKHLLYSAAPDQLPLSRVDRIRAPQRRLTVSAALLASAVLTGAATMSSLEPPFVRLFTEERSLDWAGWTVVFALLAALFVPVANWLLTRARLKELSVGPAKIAIDQEATSYFDRYLDELVYFFQETGTRVVIFEDLERFNDPGIFHALRELNALLNNAAGIEWVTFVYAIRDSLFDRTPEPPDAADRAGVDTPASDRAKFFDLIVPIAPFISHEVSADLLLGVLAELPKRDMPSKDLIRLAGRHFTDMRVLHSIRYEYGVLLDELLHKSQVTGLSPDGLFAMVLFKHANLKDYEQIRTGQSKLDNLVTCIGSAEGRLVEALDRKIAATRNDLETYGGLAGRCANAGERLLAALNRLGRMSHNGGTVTQLAVGSPNQRFTAAQVNQLTFWRALAARPAADLTVSLTSGTLVVHPEELPWILGDEHPIDTWLNEGREVTQEELDAALRHRSRLLASSLAQRTTDATLSARWPGEDVQPEDRMPELAAKELGGGLALDLVQHGYLDHNFPLYTTTYYGAFVSASARSFILQVADRHRYAPLFELDAATDVDVILERVGEGFLDTPSALNVAVFDRLIEDPRLDVALARLTSGVSDQAVGFVETYLTTGSSPRGLVERLAPMWADVLSVLGKSARISNESRRDLLDAALGELSVGIDYRLGEDERAFIQQHLSQLAVLKRHLEEHQATALARTLASHRISVESLKDVPTATRLAVISHHAFAINRANLAAITTARTSVGIDSIAAKAPDVVGHLLSDVSTYLQVLGDSKPPAHSVDNPERLLDVLQLAEGLPAEQLDQLLARARRDAILGDLSGAPESALPSLARAKRFTASAANLVAYTTSVGSVDAALAMFLSRVRRIQDADQATNDQRLGLVEAIVNTPHLTTTRKKRLIGSLSVDGVLTASSLRIDDGELFSFLLGHSLLPDTADTFNQLEALRWETKEAGIATSTDFGTYILSVSLNSEEISSLVESPRIADAVKRAVIENLDALGPRLAQGSATSIANYVAAVESPILPQGLLQLIEANAEPESVAGALGVSLASVPDSDLLEVLRHLGGEYAKLVEANGTRPKLRQTSGLDGIVARLRSLDLAASDVPLADGYVRVHMKHPR